MKRSLQFSFFIASFCLVGVAHGSTLQRVDTEIIKAVKSENYRVLKNLLKKKNSSINDLGVDQKTALDIAVEIGNAKIAILLCRYGGHVTVADNKAYMNQLCKIESGKSWRKFIAILPIWTLFLCGVCTGLIFLLDSVYCVSAIYEALFWTSFCGYIVTTSYVNNFYLESKVFEHISKQNWVIRVLE